MEFIITVTPDEQSASDVEEDRECDAVECAIDSSGGLNPVWIGCDCGLWSVVPFILC